jgi:hypothetical protein
MVETKLIFFSTWAESQKGIVRGSISFFPLLTLLIAWDLFSHDTGSSWVRYLIMVLLALVLCSAIGVQQPHGNRDALLYGALVGLCVAVSYCCLHYLYSDCGDISSYYSYVVSTVGIMILLSFLAYLTRRMLLPA